MNILITGGAGFIGSHLVDWHRAQGDQVQVVDDLSTGYRENLRAYQQDHAVTLTVADLLDWDGLDEAAAWADRIYHLAAVVGVHRVLADPLRCLDVNVQGTRRVLEAAARAGTATLIASSSEVYGFNRNASFYEHGSLVLKSADYERWSYAIAKMMDETQAVIFAKRQGLPVVTVRLFNTVGPRQVGAYGMVVPNFVRQAVAGDPVTIFGNGQQTRAFCDVRDTARALSQLNGNPEAFGRIVNVGHDQEITIQALAERVVERASSRSPICHKSYAEAYGMDFRDIDHRSPDLTLLYAITGFCHEWSLDRTLDDLIKAERTQRARRAA
ncbi:NAD-dependent epimerase/dehydratase family protein [Algiphilus sp.]|uniref:NAD-dependent epimerase/dehydratase family protein n=1 Tax=Algiphilus sp. TaxID=1872431 RepID=UPI003B52DCB7